MAQYSQQDINWRRRYRPYIVAAVLAFVLTMFVAPEVNEGSGMEPSLKDGQVLVVTKTSYSAKRGEPELGQIVVLEKTYAPEVSEDNIISRVAGLPGDTIEIKDGTVFRNGEEYQKQSKAYAGANMKVTVSEDDVFLLSDNPESSADSRNQKLGTVDMREIKGNAKFVIWPLSDIGGVH